MIEISETVMNNTSAYERKNPSLCILRDVVLSIVTLSWWMARVPCESFRLKAYLDALVSTHLIHVYWSGFEWKFTFLQRTLIEADWIRTSASERGLMVCSVSLHFERIRRDWGRFWLLLGIESSLIPNPLRLKAKQTSPKRAEWRSWGLHSSS